MSHPKDQDGQRQSTQGIVSCSSTQEPRPGLQPTLYRLETPELESGALNRSAMTRHG